MTSTTSSASAPAPSSPSAISATPTTSSSSRPRATIRSSATTCTPQFPGTMVANVGEKGYQVESMAASSSDFCVRMGSRRPRARCPTSTRRCRGSARTAAPPATCPTLHLRRPALLRQRRQQHRATPTGDYYGTKTDKPAWLYPEDGRYVPGPYAGHESGDAWVADAAMEIMDNENWSGLFITFSAIDKIGHMWGGGSVDNLGTTPGIRASAVRLGPHAVRRQERRRPARQAHRQAQGAGPVGRHADRRHRRPRLDLRPTQLLRSQRMAPATSDWYDDRTAWHAGSATVGHEPTTRPCWSR